MNVNSGSKSAVVGAAYGETSSGCEGTGILDAESINFWHIIVSHVAE